MTFVFYFLFFLFAFAASARLKRFLAVNWCMDTVSFLQDRFRSYYSQNTVTQPPAIEHREFGVGEFGKKISQRHLAFSSQPEFNRFLQQTTPFFVSYSAGYYAQPAARPMEAKQWMGGDLVFEFDSDDIPTECKQTHDLWECPRCQASGKGSPKACTQCGSTVKTNQWVCPDCLVAVKKQVNMLVSLLEEDLGFSDGLYLNFSGSKGFHVHVRSKLAQQLSPQARIEVLDFLTAQGLDLERLGFVRQNKRLFGVAWTHAKGWQKKILARTIELIEQNDASRLAVAGNVSIKTAKQVLEKKEPVVSSLRKGEFPMWIGSKADAFWFGLLEFAADSLHLNVDRQTSLDKFKIIRVPQTLHGSTGLLASPISFSEFNEFDALSRSVVFKDTPVLVNIVRTPRFFLKGEWFGPFENQTQELPEFAAVFLLARGAATL